MILSKKRKKSEHDGESDASAAPMDGSVDGESPEGSGVAEASSSNGEVQALLEECEKLRAEVRESHEKYLRTLADLDNFKRRSIKERSELLKYQGEKVLGEMLEVVDNLERALQNIGADPEQVRMGIQLIHKGLLSTLEQYGVRGVSALGETFDPNRHNALSQQESSDVQPGTVLHELKKAYFYKDKLLRPAEVVVSTAPPSEVLESPEVDEQEAEEQPL